MASTSPSLTSTGGGTPTAARPPPPVPASALVPALLGAAAAATAVGSTLAWSSAAVTVSTLAVASADLDAVGRGVVAAVASAPPLVSASTCSILLTVGLERRVSQGLVIRGGVLVIRGEGAGDKGGGAGDKGGERRGVARGRRGEEIPLALGRQRATPHAGGERGLVGRKEWRDPRRG